MSDLISRSALIEALSRNSIVEKVYIGEKSVLDVVKEQPTIEAVEVVHSEWKYYRKKGIAVCKNCSFERNLDEDFGRAIACPNCGADMRRKEQT